MNWIVFTTLLIIWIMGLIKIRMSLKRNYERLSFATEYRDKFIQLSNQFMNTFEQWGRTGDLNYELYTWLTMNVTRIQSDLGSTGLMDLIGPFQSYRARNFQIIVNTLPKFRDNTIDDFFITSVDDCLLRYLGQLQQSIDLNTKQLRNPLIWFRVGIQQILIIPLFILNSFGILTDRTTAVIQKSIFYKLVSGFVALIALASGVVTVVIGYDQTLKILSSWLE